MTTNANEYIFANEYTFSDTTNRTYTYNYEFTPTYPTAEPQEEEEFDITEIEKYIDSLKKEVVETES